MNFSNSVRVIDRFEDCDFFHLPSMQEVASDELSNKPPTVEFPGSLSDVVMDRKTMVGAK